MKIGALRQARLAASAAGSASVCLPPACGRAPAGALNFSPLPYPEGAVCGLEPHRGGPAGPGEPLEGGWVGIQILPAEKQTFRYGIRREAQQLYRSLRNPQDISRLRTAGAGLGSEQRFKGR